MIIMLNGSFGVGKTSTAEALVQTLPDAMIFDPEVVGFMVRHLTAGILPPEEITDDFQDIAIWRKLVILTAEQLYQQYKRTLIVPMTLANPTYFAEIKSGFERINPKLYHFCLTAPLEIIHSRLLARGDNERSWSWGRAIDYVPMFSDARYHQHIDTANRSIPQVVDHITRILNEV